MLRDQEQRAREYWDKSAAGADSRADFCGLLSPDARLARYRDAAEKAVLVARHGRRLAAPARVLEVGCGDGRWTAWLARRARHVVAVDISAQMIARARRYLGDQGIDNVELQVASMEELAQMPAFDLIYLGSCMHYMSDAAIEEAIPSISAMLAPAGTLLTRDTVSLIGRTFHRSEKYAGDDPAIYRPLEWYEARFEGAGLRLVDAWPTHVIPLAWRARTLLPAAWLERGLQVELALAAAEVRAAFLLRRPGPKEHRFFVYEHG
jgi:SAM-dependent methyltransferase